VVSRLEKLAMEVVFEEVPVFLERHALERFKQRCPLSQGEVFPESELGVIKMIEAVFMQSKSDEKALDLVSVTKRLINNHGKEARYLYNSGRDIRFVLVCEEDEGGKYWLVKTAERPRRNFSGGGNNKSKTRKLRLQERKRDNPYK